MAKVAMVSLGCPKNTVDAEEILGEVERAGHEIVTDLASAEVVIINTCGFIQSAKEESIDAVLDAVRLRTNGACRSVIVTGCLAQRYGDDLAREIPEADAVLGLRESRTIADAIARTIGGERIAEVGDPSAWWLKAGNRVLSTPRWTAYLRVADGCDNRCAYCAIPGIRGGFRSRTEQDVLDEAKALADSGVLEMNLIAQDITRFGTDAGGEERLPALIENLSKIEGIHWIRLLYCYPTRVSDALIRTIAANKKVCKYIDVPLQHCSARILDAMNRRGSSREYLDLFARIRAACPEAALRTTFIVGFPGETEAEFDELMEFVREVGFDRAGVFCYSEEEGTPAAGLPEKVSSRVSERRHRKLMELQREISLRKNQALVGSRMEVLVEALRGKHVIGRSYRDAPEIDGLVYVEGAGEIVPGEFAQVEVTAAQEYDLFARPIA